MNFDQTEAPTSSSVSMLHSFKFVTMLGFGILALLAIFSNHQLPTDSFQHYHTSVDIVKERNWNIFFFDLFRRPIATLVYGAIGQLGMIPARLLSVLFVILTAILVFKIVQVLFPEKEMSHPLTWFAFFVCQISVFQDAYVTMTEIFAAFFLSLGLLLYFQNRLVWAYLSLGLLPLARLETALIMALCFVFLSLEQLFRQNWTKKILGQVVFWNALGSLPFILFWAMGIGVTEDPFWLWQKVYPYPRSSEIIGLLTVNAFTGLPGVLTAPLLFLFFGGMLHILFFKPPPSCRSWSLVLLYTIVFVHSFFLSSIVPHPRGSHLGDLAVTAIKPSNYNVLAPIFAIFIFAGAGALLQMLKPPKRDKHWIKWGIGALFLTECALVGFFFLQQTFETSLVKGLFKLILHHILLWGLIIWIGHTIVVGSKKNGLPLNLTMLVGFVIFSLLVSVPLFWHPLRFYDQAHLTQQEFCQWYHQNDTSSVPRIVQDLNSRLDRFCGIEGVDTTWTWAGNLFDQSVQNAPAGSLILVDTNQHHQPAPRYSPQLMTLLSRASEFRMRQKSTPLPVASWQTWLNRISARNQPKGWLVYEKR